MTYRRMVTIVSRRVPSKVDGILTVLFLAYLAASLAFRLILHIPPTWLTVGLFAYGGYLIARVVDYLRLAAAVGRAALPRKDTQ